MPDIGMLFELMCWAWPALKLKKSVRRVVLTGKSATFCCTDPRFGITFWSMTGPAWRKRVQVESFEQSDLRRLKVLERTLCVHSDARALAEAMLLSCF
jgi:DMSO/TMAO reductase YedYZ molybdopterin-dependent catalytic subunit